MVHDSIPSQRCASSRAVSVSAADHSYRASLRASEARVVQVAAPSRFGFTELCVHRPFQLLDVHTGR